MSCRRAYFLLPLLALLAFSAPVFSQNRTVKILGLAVEGNVTSSPDIIRLSSGLSAGQEVTADDIQSAVRSLWEMDAFSDIEILVDREVRDGVFLNIKVTEHPRLEEVEVNGNKKLKKDEIDTALNLYKSQRVSPRILVRARKTLKDKYKEKGYLLAEIKTSTEEIEGTDRVNIIIDIDEGSKVQIQAINFYGNETFDSGKLRKQMKKTKEDKWWRGADFDREKYEEDKELVLDFYRNNGFRDVEFLRDSVYYGPERNDLYIDLYLAEGIQYYFGDIAWTGNTIYTNERLEGMLDFKKGDVYSKEKISNAIFEEIGGLYYDNGYIYANADPNERVDSNVVDILFMITENDQAHINKIHVKGNTKTKEKVIRRTLRMFPGDVFSRDLLMRSHREVTMLNYFSKVEPAIQPVDENSVDVVIEVEEKSTDTAHMSAGYSERDKMIGNIGVSMNNLFGNGQRLSFDWNFGRSYRSFMISFTEPFLFDKEILTGFSFFDTKRDPLYIGYRQRSRGGSVRFGRRFKWPDNYFRGDWIFSVDQTELSDFLPQLLEANPYFQYYENVGALTSVSIAQILSRNSLDHPEFPQRGSEISLRTELAGGPFGGNVSYHKHLFATNWFMPAIWKFILHVGFEAGYLSGFGDNSQIPYLEHFFMGGEGMSRATPLRGYSDPLSGYASQIGDKTLLKYQFEIRVPIAPNPTIFGLVFAEAGNTWENLAHTDPFDLRRSVGVGARVFMPMIGVIGFDYAYGFDYINETGERYGKWKPHFIFGRGF